LKLLTLPSPLLSTPANDVELGNPLAEDIVTKMFDFIASKGDGLSAPQVGVPLRIIVVDCDGMSFYLINPIITKTVGSVKVAESCLSIPNKRFIVERPKIVKVKGKDLKWNDRAYKLRGHLAHVACHEVDHTNGVTIDQIAVAEVLVSNGKLPKVVPLDRSTENSDLIDQGYVPKT
jgi:peptide deformylase